MSNNSRFTIAVHTLTLLAQSQGDPVTSEYIAGSVNTNPVVIRRVLGAMRAAGLVTSQGGNGGGWRLANSPQVITLRDVYRAVEEEDEPLFPMHPRSPNSLCPVGRHIQHALSTRFDAAKRALENELARTSIEDVLSEVLAEVG
jgi:Rrf2 family protein